MESGIDPGQDYYTQDYYNYDQGYDLPQYGSRRKLISPSGLYDEYGEVVVDDDGSYYYSPQESDAEHGGRKRRIKLVLDREHETSSTGDDSAPEPLRGRSTTTFNNHTNVNGGLYVAQNGSVVRTRRSVTPTKPPSPVFSSRLAKHFKKLDKMAATLEEKLPLNSPRTAADNGIKTLRTFKSSGPAGPASPSFTNSDIHKTVNVFDTRQSSISSESASNVGTEQPSNVDGGTDGGLRNGTSEDRELGEGERESRVDGNNSEGDEGLVMRDLPRCPSERTQSDEEELWMGPWNNLHIPMTKL